MNWVDIFMDQSNSDVNTKSSGPVLIDAKVSCGFSTLIENFQEKALSLDNYLVKKPAATFFLRAQGDSMLDTIKPGDLLIVDRSLVPNQGDIVIVVWRGEFVCKRLYQLQNSIELRPDNPQYPITEIPFNESEDFSIWGVVTYVIHSTK
jgi:DNA polymerase V